MDLYLKALIMGIIEGITEFLPISSTGHLVITGHLINFPKNFGKTFDIVIQLGAILAVIFYYKDRIKDSLKNLKPGQSGFNLWKNVLIAFVPSAVTGVLFIDYIDHLLGSPFGVAIALIVGAILMLIVQRKFNNYNIDSIDKIDSKTAFWIGLSQCLSLIPGMSRSASTIMGGMVNKLSLKTAAEFSFFLAIPTMFGATFYKMIKGFGQIPYEYWIALAIGFIVSFVVAYLVIDKFLNFLGKHSLDTFSYYRIFVGIIMLFIFF